MTGSLEPSVADGLVRGEVLGINETLSYSGRTIDEAFAAFRVAVDAYIDSGQGCSARPYSGHLNVRIDPEAHRLAAVRAAESGMSMSAWVESAIRRGATELAPPRAGRGTQPAKSAARRGK